MRSGRFFGLVCFPLWRFEAAGDENFFFPSDDPQLRADQVISKIFLQEPIDIISAPGVNVAIGMGVDAMFHMLI